MSDDLIEKGKESAAIKAVDENVKKGMVLGIGSGSTVVYAVKRIAELNNENDLDLKCIPTSFQAYNLIIDNGLNMVSIDMYPVIDLDIDGADEIDENLNAIKGGGGCLVQEKIIASISKNFVLIADYRKDSKNFGENWKKGIPIEIIPYKTIHEERLEINTGEWSSHKITYDDYLETLTQAERKKELEKKRYNTFLVFHSGNVIMSGAVKEFMAAPYYRFLDIIKECRSEIEEKLDN